ncbi:DUF3817 domain-containing protein [Haliangium ochraceum]|uniref:DUF3817 domain-containing protein n=1 Tax=Haliangium ochraceum (strain DSM 14365 / JCM 11303 / SMP-2) TaxID=502025 RepID=D0LM05_HALO1|nr:DUF3817 domain-containing protein [Haliangium ochraceum]ACY15183.1 conserved hypothetical protein [Haliangium ochraceum DSM 14365]
MIRSPLRTLRRVSVLEGISFLVLLGVAMPLKYLGGIDMAVKIVGWAHGVLFVLLCGVLLVTYRSLRWPLSRAALVFAAALVPLGPFLIDRKLAAEERDGSP